eukprot:3804220-Amphidinium_carterae.1
MAKLAAFWCSTVDSSRPSANWGGNHTDKMGVGRAAVFRWFLCTADAANAFLQTSKSEIGCAEIVAVESTLSADESKVIYLWDQRRT